MDARTAEILDGATRDFYDRCAGSFSKTRIAPWPGWERLAAILPGKRHMDVLDVGCGNLRFERFLEERFPDASFAFHSLDRCAPLAEGKLGNLRGHVDLICADVSADPSALSGIPECDLAVSLALLHHVPEHKARARILGDIVGNLKPGGIACITLWQFHRDPGILESAIEATRRGMAELGVELDMDAGDYLLGWQGEPGIYRFCHDFSDDEVDSLAAIACDAGARLLDAYSADGRTGDLNRYVVLQRDVD